MRAVADSATVPVSVHLDHASDPHLIAGRPPCRRHAVRADGSKLPAEENAAFVRSVREQADADRDDRGGIAGNEDRSTAATRIRRA
jgi:tagatose 1,6-diphosphate aldolase GatY/KbaY